jgi:hypothetical protein
MSTLNHKLRRSRTFRLELLESRELLSAGGEPAYQAAEVSPLARAHLDTIKGSSKQSPSLRQARSLPCSRRLTAARPSRVP